MGCQCSKDHNNNGSNNDTNDSESKQSSMSLIRRVSSIRISSFSMSSISSETIRRSSTSSFNLSIDRISNTVNPINDTNSNVLMSRVTVRDDNNIEEMAVQLVNESRRIFRIYSGIDTVLDINFKWSVRSESKAIRVSATNVVNSKYLAIKSTSKCRADKYTITNLLYDVKRVSEYESNIDGYEVLYDLDASSSIRRFKYKKISPVAARDAVVMTTWIEVDDGSILITTLSVPTVWHPPPKSFVRAFVLSSGAIIKPLNKDECEITFLTHCDVGGYVPAALLNMIIVNTPVKTMSKVVSLAEDMNKKHMS